jgi:thiol-disulfide isomerase/thioredoxin
MLHQLAKTLLVLCLVCLAGVYFFCRQPGASASGGANKSEVLSPDDAADYGAAASAKPTERPASYRAARRRLFRIKPSGYLSVSSYAVPGYYTVLIFSAAWCEPCKLIQPRAIEWLEKYPNLVIVDLDIGARDTLDPSSSAILADFDRQTALPAALFINPFGIYMNAGRRDGIAPPLSGVDSITGAISTLASRAHKDVIPFGAASTKRLRELASWQAENGARATDAEASSR